jgi:hypothetical protein
MTGMLIPMDGARALSQPPTDTSMSAASAVLTAGIPSAAAAYAGAHLAAKAATRHARAAAAAAACGNQLAAGIPERSLLLLSKSNPLRLAALRIVLCGAFDAFILACIAANCICLALGSGAPGFDGSPLGRALVRADAFFLAVFDMEMLLKWVAFGVFAAPGTYFRDGAPARTRLRLHEGCLGARMQAHSGQGHPGGPGGGKPTCSCACMHGMIRSSIHGIRRRKRRLTVHPALSHSLCV